jgi:hypothetical protein
VGAPLVLLCPVQVSPELRDLICQLLDKDVLKRLEVQGALQVSTHAHMQRLEAFLLITPPGLACGLSAAAPPVRMLQWVWHVRC